MNMDKKRYLNWFLAFLNVDLENLKLVKYKKLAAETVYHLRLSEADIVRNDSKYDLERYKDALNDFVLRVWDSFDFKRSEEIIGCSLQTLQQHLREKTDPFFNSLESVNSVEDVVIQGLAPIESKSVLKVRDGNFQSSISMNGDPAVILFSEFIHSLDGLSFDVFGRCQGCKNWYARLTKKEKNFCSDNCASLAGVQKKRKELKNDPEKYKAMKMSEARRSQKNRDAEREALILSGKIVCGSTKYKDG